MTSSSFDELGFFEESGPGFEDLGFSVEEEKPGLGKRALRAVGAALTGAAEGLQQLGGGQKIAQAKSALEGEQSPSISEAFLGELSPLERGLRRGGEAAATTFGLGGGAATAGLSGAGGILGQATEEAGGGPLMQLAAEVLPIVVSPYASSRLLPEKAQKTLVQSARKLGMTEKEIAPLVRGKRSIGLAASKAAKRGTAQKITGKTRQGLRRAMGSLQKEAASLPPVTPDVKTSLLDDLQGIQNTIREAHGISSQTERGEKLLESIAKDIGRRDPTPQSLLKTYREVNREFSKSPQVLSQVNEALREALKKASPDLGQKLEDTNLLYQRLISLDKKLGKEAFNYFDAAEAYGVVSGLFKGDLGRVGKIIGTDAGRKAFTKAMLGPRGQGALRKLSQALAQNKEGVAQAALRVIEGEVEKNLQNQEESQ